MKIPLTKLLRANQAWGWGEEQRRAFEDLKRALTTAPVLARPDFSKPFTIHCDASGLALGAMLSQTGEDGEHPIVYISRMLTPSERNYTVSELECLAVLWSIKKFRPYVEGYEFVVVTDHSALLWLKNLKDPTGRLARWALEMQQWRFTIIHRKGALHKVPDALSRMYEEGDNAREVGGANDGDLEEEMCVIAGFREEVLDPWYIKMRENVLSSPKKYPKWKVEDGLLYKFHFSSLLDPILYMQESWKLVVPAELRDRVIEEAHSSPSMGHFGVEKTFDRVARDYYWSGFYYDVARFIRECGLCAKYKIPQQGQQGLMGRRVVDRPWAVVACDLMEFPPSKAQNKYLIVFQDLFTRWIELKPVRRADAKSVAKAFEELILFRWEAPDYFVCDNGKEFDNKIVKDTLATYGVKPAPIPPYHAQADPVERTNRTLKTLISMYVKSNHREWDVHLHEFRHAINTAMQSSTRVSPAFLNYGRHPRPVKSLRREVETITIAERMDPNIWADRVRRLDVLRDMVAKNIEKAGDRQEKYYNRGKRGVVFNVGDRVLRRVHVLSDASKHFNAKLAPKYEGPYEIVEVKSPSVYVLGQNEGGSRKISMVHASDIKRYVPPRGL